MNTPTLLIAFVILLVTSSHGASIYLNTTALAGANCTNVTWGCAVDNPAIWNGGQVPSYNDSAFLVNPDPAAPLLFTQNAAWFVTTLTLQGNVSLVLNKGATISTAALVLQDYSTFSMRNNTYVNVLNVQLVNASGE